MVPKMTCQRLDGQVLVGFHLSRTGLAVVSTEKLREKFAKINEAQKAMKTTKLAWCRLQIA